MLSQLDMTMVLNTLAMAAALCNTDFFSIIHQKIIPVCLRSVKRVGELTFTTAAAASQTPPDDQTDGVLRRRGLALCCRGNGALGRWRK